MINSLCSYPCHIISNATIIRDANRYLHVLCKYDYYAYIRHSCLSIIMKIYQTLTLCSVLVCDNTRIACSTAIPYFTEKCVNYTLTFTKYYKILWIHILCKFNFCAFIKKCSNGTTFVCNYFVENHNVIINTRLYSAIPNPNSYYVFIFFSGINIFR